LPQAEAPDYTQLSMRLKTMASLLALLVVFQSPVRADLAIMPLGDSITFGAHLTNGGYRYPLFVNLTQAGIAFHYLGQSTECSLALPYPVQWRHNGYPGATIKGVLDNLDGNLQSPDLVVPNLGGYWMTGGKAGGDPVNPDLVLLLAGTNNIIHLPARGGTDLATMKTQFTELVNWFSKNRPNTMILIGTVLPITGMPATQNETVIAFDAWLKSSVSNFGPKCQLVDLYSRFLKPDGSVDAHLLGDGIHPTQAGYDIMGKAWSDAIETLAADGALKKDVPSPLGSSFALPTGKQSPIPTLGNIRASPATATPGAVMTIAATLSAGNNALTAPVVAFTLKDAKGRALEGITVPTSPALSNLAPHGEAPLTFNFKLPDKIESGAYDIGMTETAAEGSAIVRYGGKITVSP
jgi:lysophospholipase L1-like esterase